MENMRRLLAGIASIAICGSVGAVDGTSSNGSNWVDVGHTDTHNFGIRKGSFEITRTKGGADIAVVIGQTTDLNSKSIKYYQWYVSKNDCISGLGNLVMLDTNGNYVNEVDFVENGESVASSIADVICTIYLGELQKQEDKGI